MNHNAKILVIDDDEDIRIYLNAILSKRGYATKASESGTGIIDKIKEFTPDVILVDMNLPDKNGPNIVKEIRETYSSLEIPIIMISATTESNQIVDTLRLGANDYITKPIDIEVTLDRVNTQVKLAELSKMK